jgi:hypothetical protein
MILVVEKRKRKRKRKKIHFRVRPLRFTGTRIASILSLSFTIFRLLLLINRSKGPMGTRGAGLRNHPLGTCGVLALWAPTVWALGLNISEVFILYLTSR